MQAITRKGNKQNTLLTHEEYLLKLGNFNLKMLKYFNGKKHVPLCVLYVFHVSISVCHK